VSMLAGVRWLHLHEKLNIAESESDLPDIFGNPGLMVTLHDNFDTTNNFYGAQLGLESEMRVGPVFFLLGGKVAAGQNRSAINISGDTTVNDPVNGVTFDPTRGLLVQPSNIGNQTKNTFAVVPEVYFSLGWEFNDYVRFSLGYNALYWTRVLRPGDQIDPVVNVGPVGFPGQLGTSPHPLVPFKTTDFWAQGLSVSLMLSY